jgi:hypothetical protein
MTEQQPSRTAFHGSCHCKHARFIAMLTFPPEDTTSNHPKPESTVRLRKCNCSTCHKMGTPSPVGVFFVSTTLNAPSAFFHVRPKDPYDDFILLSPLDPESGGLSNYTCFDARINWYFCPKCGVRCFAFCGDSEVRSVDVEEWMGRLPAGDKTQVWVPKPSSSDKISYLSLNAHAFEPGQEGLDLREWVEKKWVCYLDCKDELEDDRYSKPHIGGTY